MEFTLYSKSKDLWNNLLCGHVAKLEMKFNEYEIPKYILKTMWPMLSLLKGFLKKAKWFENDTFLKKKTHINLYVII
jgi:hypothetical protein